MSEELEFKPAEIVAQSPYKETALIEEQDKVVDAMVDVWNKIITEFENKTILFSLQVKDLLKGYPEKTTKEVIEKFRNHPRLLNKAHSKDRIMQGLRLVSERPDLIAWSNGVHEYMEEPYLKNDGSIHWEFYFQLYKWNLDPGLRVELEENGKKENWSVRKLIAEMGKLQQEKEEPNTRRRLQKAATIKELIFMFKDLQPDDLNKVKWFIVDEFRDKLVRWNKYQESLKEGEKDGKPSTS